MRTPPTAVSLVAAICAGGMVGLQSRINGELGTRLHSSLQAAATSFAIALVIVAAVVPFRRAGLARLRHAHIVPWWWLGGLGGAFFVAASSHAVPQIGVALVAVCLVAGTTAGASASDQLGLGPSGRHPASPWRYLGVALVITAVAIGAVGQRGAVFKPLLFVVLFAAGAASAVQQAGNGQLAAAAGDPMVAMLVNFTGGTIALTLVGLATGEFSTHFWPHQPWLYLGGPLGVFYVLVGATTVRRLGVLRFVLAAVAGQLVAAVVIDAAWPEPGTTLHVATIVGAVITVAGVVLSGRGGASGRRSAAA
jgi:bacterial/archaeal transporter family-2 protein